MLTHHSISLIELLDQFHIWKGWKGCVAGWFFQGVIFPLSKWLGSTLKQQKANEVR